MGNNELAKQFRSFKAYIFFAEAWMALLFARIILVYVPFKRIAPYLKNNLNKPSGIITNESRYYDETQISLKRACRYSPWRTMCFEQAIAAKIMLNRRKIKSELYFGLYKDKITLIIQAHAWLKCGDRTITGGHNSDKFTIISVF